MSHVMPVRRLPSATTIDVWVIELDVSLAAEPQWNEILSRGERDRAERFVFARDAHRYRHCRAMLRMGLAWYLREKPGAIELIADKTGKPRLAGHPQLYFNVTHSAGLGAIAFASQTEVGIDVEAIREGIEVMDLASQNFTANEIEELESAATVQERVTLFFRIWTRKEAVLKASGAGIAGGLRGVNVLQQPDDRLASVSADRGNGSSLWFVDDLKPKEGFVGAVAASRGEWSIQTWHTCYKELIGILA